MRKKSKGVIIPFVMVFGTILAMILVSLLGYVAYRYEQSVRQTAKSNAFQAAETGLNYYHWYVLHTLEGLSLAQLEIYWSGSPLGIPFYEGTIKSQSGKELAKYRIEVTKPAKGSTIIQAKVTGWDLKHPTVKRIIEARLRKPSWSEYCVIANDIMRFGTGTETWGPIFSNNGIHFDGIAHNLVSSNIPNTYFDPDYGVYKPGVWTALPNEATVFLAGKKFPDEYKDFSKISVDFSVMKEQSQPANGGLYFPPLNQSYCGYHLKLRDDGKVAMRKVEKCDKTAHRITKETSDTYYNMPTNGLIFVADYLWIEGKIKDKHLTVAAADTTGSDPADIYIEHDTTSTYKDGRDVLGIVAQNNITIGLYSDDVLDIDAALIAQSGRVGRDYYTSSDSPTYYRRDTINVNGAIATNRRYGFAWTCGGYHCSGYLNRNLIFDNNLLYTPPPFFPTGEHYSVDLWEEKQ